MGAFSADKRREVSGDKQQDELAGRVSLHPFASGGGWQGIVIISLDHKPDKVPIPRQEGEGKKTARKL